MDANEPGSELTVCPDLASSNATAEAVDLLGMSLLKTDEQGLLDRIFAELDAGRGGWLLTANLDFLRRYCHEPEMRSLYSGADLCVADGMPLVWAAALQGEPLPERIAGSSLIWSLAERCAQQGRHLYLLGGEPGAGEGAAEVFRQRFPGLAVQTSAPWISAPPTAEEIDTLVASLAAAPPDLLLVGLGSPKQEQVIEVLRERFPRLWMIGVGVSFSFASGKQRRAPIWMRRAGLEWAHRLSQEPRRLAKRYLVHDLPFAFELFGRALWQRTRRRV